MRAPLTLSNHQTTKTPQHTLLRVRNNQRRHRARVKQHIETLEDLLRAKTQQLAEAQRHLATAHAELAALRSQHRYDLGSQTAVAAPSNLTCSAAADDSPLCPVFATALPPVQPGESTTLCHAASAMLEQHNVRNVDLASVQAVLADGCRAEVTASEGCRVSNGVLMEVLDVVSA